jgi:hypothetical protein
MAARAAGRITQDNWLVKEGRRRRSFLNCGGSVRQHSFLRSLPGSDVLYCSLLIFFAPRHAGQTVVPLP